MTKKLSYLKQFIAKLNTLGENSVIGDFKRFYYDLPLKLGGNPIPIAACNPITKEIIFTYPSTKIAAKELGTKPMAITAVLKGKRQQHHGYTFVYV